MRAGLLLAVLLLSALPAQSIAWSPAGTGTQEGNDNNTIPLWSLSATYQQIHDQGNMSETVGGQATSLLGLVFRQDGDDTGTIAGRTLDVQITVGVTTVTSAAPSMTFTTNLGPTPTVVLPYTPVSFPTLSVVSRPNPPGILVPWATPFAYVPVPGAHFCWQWRHANATTSSWATMDAERSVTGANEGTGCLTSGQSQTAIVDIATLDVFAMTYRSRVSYAAASAPAVLALGGQRINVSLPGQCAPLLVNPLVFLSGATDATGRWDMTLPIPNLRGGPRVELLGQYAWLDALQPTGIGLSDMSAVRTSFRGTLLMSRLWAGPYNGGAGWETATTATGSNLGYGLVVGFMTP